MKLTPPILSNKLKVKCQLEASAFTIVVMAKEEGKPAFQITQTKTIPILVPGAEMTVDLFKDLTWDTAPRAEKGWTYVARVIALGTCAADESETTPREFTVTGKDVVKWKKATSPAAPAPEKTASADSSASASPEKPAPTPGSASPAPAPAPAARVFKFPVSYWDLQNRLTKTVKNRLKELQDAGNTEFWSESEEIITAFKELSANHKMPTAEEVKKVRDFTEDMITRMHARCEEIRAAKRAENTSVTPKVPAIQNPPTDTTAPKSVPPVIIPATSVVDAPKKTLGANTPAPAPKATAPTAAQKPAPATAPAPVKITPAPTANTTTVKVEPIEVKVVVQMPPATPATLPPTTPPPAPPATASVPATPASSNKLTWVEWFAIVTVLALITLLVISVLTHHKKAAAPVTPVAVAKAVETGITTNVVTVNNTNGNTSVQVVKATDDKSPISVSGAISVGNDNSGTVIGVQNNNQTYNYYYGDKKPKKMVSGRDDVNNDVIDKEQQTGNVEKVLRIPGWKPWPKVDCSLLVLIPRPEVVEGEISKTVYLEDGQTAVLDIPWGHHYWVKESASVTALEGIDEFCHNHAAGLQFPAAVKERDRQIGKTPVYQLWLTPKNGKAMALHIKLIRD